MYKMLTPLALIFSGCAGLPSKSRIETKLVLSIESTLDKATDTKTKVSIELGVK